MYKAIIIDDEEMARVLLEQMLNEYCPQVQTMGCYPDLPSGIKGIQQHKPDIVFLDIEMPSYSGLEILDFFDKEVVDFAVIFVTAYNNYAIQAFKLSAIDYILKPVEIDDLIQSIKLFEAKGRSSNLAVLKDNLKIGGAKRLALSTLNQIHFVDVGEIMFFKADGAYTKVYLADGKEHHLSKGLKSFETMLEDNVNFIRCHKSFLVNINHVTQYLKPNGGTLLVNDIHEVDISPLKVAEVLSKLGC
jgi:two-component system LytT family response regulator